MSHVSSSFGLASNRDPLSDAPRIMWAEGLIQEFEAERRQLADRINEDTVQTLAHIARVLQGLEDVPGTPARAAQVAREAGVLAADASEKLRELARGLRPPLLDDVGLGPALVQLAADFRASAGIPTYTDPGEFDRISRQGVELVLFRVAQAALQNAEQHSAATRIDIRLRQRGDRVTLSVTDNGIGFSSSAHSSGMRTGIHDMRERLRAVGGKLVIRSLPRVGTVVRASAPIAPMAGNPSLASAKR